MHGCGKVSNCYKDETDLLVFVLMWKKQQTHCSFKTTLKNVAWSPICGNMSVCFILITHKTVLKRHAKNHRMVRDYGWGGWGPSEDCMYVYIYNSTSFIPIIFYREDISNFIYLLINHFHFTDGEAILESWSALLACVHAQRDSELVSQFPCEQRVAYTETHAL